MLKRKVISVLCIAAIILSLLPCGIYAENAESNTDNLILQNSANEMTKQEDTSENVETDYVFLNKIEQELDQMNDDDEIIIEAYYQGTYAATPVQTIEWTNDIRGAVYALFEELYTEFDGSIKKADKAEVEKKLAGIEGNEVCDYYTDVIIGGEQYICMRDNYIITPWCAGEIETPEAFVEYIEYFIDDYMIFDVFGFQKKRVFDRKNADLEKKTYEGISFEYIERLNFDITLDENFRGTPLAEAGTQGSVINCTLERLNLKSRNDIYFLTVKGNIGKKQFFYPINSLKPLKNDVIEFDSGQIYENNEMITYNLYASGADYQIEIGGDSKDGIITEVTVKLYRKPIGMSYTAISGTNIKYEYLDDVTHKRGLYELFDITEEQIRENNPEVQDPENYKTELRTWDDNGDEVYGYYINFIAVTKVYPDIKEQYAPDWLKELGTDAKITFVGVTQTLNGADRMNYTMLLFAGNKGIKWFDMSSLKVNDALKNGDYTSENPLEVEISYSSLKFFDGFSKIKNTLSNDKLSGKISFVNDGELTLDSISVDLGTQELELKADDLIFIGGGKMTYEKLWNISF